MLQEIYFRNIIKVSFPRASEGYSQPQGELESSEQECTEHESAIDLDLQHSFLGQRDVAV